MAKKIKVVFKLNLQAGAANPAPPVGPILGQHGVNIMEFCKAYNAQTQDKKGQTIPAEVTVFEDRSFTFVLKLPPVSAMIKQVLGIQSGAKIPNKETVGTLTTDQVKEIAQKKMADMNTTSLEQAMSMVMGTARSMGVKIA